MVDALQPTGINNFWAGDFVRELTDEAIAVHLDFGPRVPTVPSLLHLYPMNGAVSRVGIDETAFAYRDVGYVHVILATDADRHAIPENIAWAREYWAALHPHSAGGGYVNFMTEEGEERIAAAYRENYPRPREIKRRYDPDNLFRVNQNIRPAGV
ncbi:hypothetical protein BH24CHL3_BH24CHL3_07540 [soil metagenome]